MLTHILNELAIGPQEPGVLCPSAPLLEGAMQVIMKGEAEPEQIAALLMGLRCRGEQAEHLAATVKVMLAYAKSLPGEPPCNTLFDTCGPGGGGRETVNISTATALLAATAGLAVAKHGNRSVTSRSGSADALEVLGVKLDCTEEKSHECLLNTNFCFLFAPYYHPAMRFAGPVRKKLKTRTIFNLAGPLSNPAHPTHQLVGVVDRGLVSLMANTLKILGRQRALVVHGRNGMDEISLAQVTEGLHLRADGSLEQIVLEPKDFGVKMIELADLVISSPQDSAKKIREVLEGREGPIADEINANVAAILWLADKVNNVGQGFEMAREIQQSGKGADLLDNVVKITNS